MKTPITYYGGKQRMLPHILPLIPEHTSYSEAFCGGAAVFWAKQPSPIEVINDTNRCIVTFWQVLQERPDELATEIAKTPLSRALHADAAVIYKHPHLFTDLRVAWAVWVQASMSFTSKILAGFGYCKMPANGKDPQARSATNRRERFEPASLEALKERLKGTQIECFDALRILQSRDHAEAFHYVDPPYPGSDQGHYKGYTDADFEALLATLASLEGRFMLSCYPHPALEEAAQAHGWTCIAHDQSLSAVKGKARVGRRKTEVLTVNYPLREG